MFLSATTEKTGFTVSAVGPPLVEGTTYDVRVQFAEELNFTGGEKGGTGLAWAGDTGEVELTVFFRWAQVVIHTAGFVHAWIENAGSDPANPQPIEGLQLVFPVQPQP